MEYTWNIQTLKRYFAGDVVTNVRWECTATYNSASAREDGGVDIPYLDPTSSGFIPYNDLTQTEVWGWLNAQTGSFVSSSIQEQLSSSVDLKLNPHDPIIVYGVPW